MLQLLRFSIFIAAAIIVKAADHGTFKDCARSDFCTYLRVRAPMEKYVIVPESLILNNDGTTVNFALNSVDEYGNLTLTLYGVEGNIVRVKIVEADNPSRYELKDVLDGEPTLARFDSVFSGDTSAEIAMGTSKVVVHFSPFSIDFYENDVNSLTFNGDRLIMERYGDSNEFSFGLTYPQAGQLYGIHEHAEHLALQNTAPGGMDPYRLRNLDVYAYELYSPMALYGAIPVLYGHGPSRTTGVFFHNAAEHWIEINNQDSGSEALWMAESGALDLFILLGPGPVEIVRQYTSLTGKPHLPQLWTLGYHQSRYNYVSQEDVKDVVARFDSSNFPIDVIWLDIDYTDGKKYFTWDPVNFGDPDEMQRNLSSTNRKLVVIIDPHIKVDDSYNVYTEAISRDYFVKNADGSVFQGDCWPGTSGWIDFLNPQARNYIASRYYYENFPHTSPTLGGIWNDMNEPSVFDNSIEMTIPWDRVHIGGVTHRDVYNIYGLLHTMSTHQGLMERDLGLLRPFVLTRSHFAGTQRYSAIWTGDNTARWEYLPISYAECLNANMLGIVFCGADVGGFLEYPNDELFQRWYQAGAWLPFFRAHSSGDTPRREPYLYPENIQAVLREAIQIRYKHLPVWYTLFFEHIRTGDPIIRPLFYHYPSDSNVFKIDDQLLVGRDILVKAVGQPEVTSVPVYFPGGGDELWISITDSTVYHGTGAVDIPVDIQSIPVFYRRGSVIVRKDTVRPNTVEMANDGHTLYVTLGSDNKAHGTVYLDDNESFRYTNNLEYNYISIDVEGENVTFTKIDDSHSDNFEFVVDNIIFNTIDRLPTEGKSGSYSRKIYNKDIRGNLLSSIRIGDKFVLEL